MAVNSFNFYINILRLFPTDVPAPEGTMLIPSAINALVIRKSSIL